MTDTTRTAVDTARDRFHRAALALATDVSVQDRLENDPHYAGDRSDRAVAMRRQMHAEALAEFRAAQAAFDLEFTLSVAR